MMNAKRIKEFEKWVEDLTTSVGRMRTQYVAVGSAKVDSVFRSRQHAVDWFSERGVALVVAYSPDVLLVRKKLNKTAQQFYDEDFLPAGDQRSQAYKQGVMAGLKECVDGFVRPEIPYADGTAEIDAWRSGRREGLALTR